MNIITVGPSTVVPEANNYSARVSWPVRYVFHMALSPFIFLFLPLWEETDDKANGNEHKPTNTIRQAQQDHNKHNHNNHS
jgi:hypothetical protein